MPDDPDLPGQHPAVTPDFLFGNLAASPESVREWAAALSAVRHQGQIAPLRPTHSAPTLITATTGPARPTTAAWLTYTSDGSRPAGWGNSPQRGTSVPLAWAETRWSEPLWDYLSVWQAVIPPQPPGTWVRYQIVALPPAGSGLAPHYADADEAAAGGAQPVFSYLVDAPRAPAWAHAAIIYHIFLDRFNPGAGRAWPPLRDPRGKMGGTLRGVTEQLGYIADLGADTIWLSPLFASPTYHRYDATDLLTVDPPLGTNDDLRELVDEAHRRGLRIILDLVPNHISNRHPLFLEAQRDPHGPYRDWFAFTRWPDEYRMFMTTRGMPRLNNEHPPARAWFFAAARYWLEELAVDGYRLDYVLGPTLDFWTDYYRTMKGLRPDSFHFVEAWHGSETMRGYAGRADGALDFTFLSAIRSLIASNTLTLSAFDRFLEQNRRYYPPGFLTPTFLDNHDMNRFLWVVRGDVRKLKLAAAIQCTLAPPPIIYYGTEAGLRQTGDVRTDSDTQARGPMAWGAAQDADLVAYYRRLLHIRRAHPAIWTSPRTTLHLDEAARAYAYMHGAPGQAGLVTTLNLSDEARRIIVPLPPGQQPPTPPHDLLNAHPIRQTDEGLAIELPPLAAALIPLEPVEEE